MVLAFISLKSFDVLNHCFSVLEHRLTCTTYTQLHPFVHLSPPGSSLVFLWEVKLFAVSSHWASEVVIVLSLSVLISARGGRPPLPCSLSKGQWAGDEVVSIRRGAVDWQLIFIKAAVGEGGRGAGCPGASCLSEDSRLLIRLTYSLCGDMALQSAQIWSLLLSVCYCSSMEICISVVYKAIESGETAEKIVNTQCCNIFWFLEQPCLMICTRQPLFIFCPLSSPLSLCQYSKHGLHWFILFHQLKAILWALE